ncbi:MAG: hypothetical protein ACJAY8_001336 [Sphingobacteriales bacterium]|jgi:hypothetical protein
MIYLFILFFGLFSNNHKFYVSITEMEYKDTTTTLEVSTKTFADDIEFAIQKQCHCVFSVDQEGETDFYYTNYLESIIQVNEQSVPVHFIGLELKGDVAMLYYTIPIKSLPSELSFPFLQELFEEQVNIIHYTSGEVKKSHYINDEAKTIPLI